MKSRARSLKPNEILLVVGFCATNDRKPRQVRKEATVAVLFVCRRGAWLPTSFFLLWTGIGGLKSRAPLLERLGDVLFGAGQKVETSGL